jgi:hypothetical protein
VFDALGVRRIHSAGGMRSRNGERIGRRPRSDTSAGGPPARVVGEIVELPANVYCPACDRDTLNSIPVPSP